MPLTDATRKQIDDLVQQKKVVLFMKGNRSFPQCGFSAQVVQILNELAPSYETVNVLTDPALRDGIKEYSSWPTIPQLYVEGKFVGGCDIVKEMYASGELKKVLGAAPAAAAPAPAKVPTLRITDRAAASFKQAAEEAGPGDKLHLEINGAFQYDLFYGPSAPGEIEVKANGVALCLDNASAGRADGLTIDFVDQPGGGFKIDNPNEPPRVKPLTVNELKAMLDRGDKLELFDVRTEGERVKAKIDRARWLDDQGKRFLDGLDKEARIVFHCHHGGRSRAAAEEAVRRGFRNVYNLEGGIEAWSTAIDPSVPRY
jgi:monothiol glutaredoxin